MMNQRFVIAALLLGTFACRDKEDREPQSDATAQIDIPSTLARQGLTVTRYEDYVVPLTSGAMGSPWCGCRSVGTTPHVGQDFTGPQGQMKSIAMANAVVDTVRLDGNCGWSVYIKDGLGFMWRYLHLNKPDLREGQVVRRGQLIGLHTDFTYSSCLQGAHLHLERLSSGALNDAVGYNVCSNARKKCNFDPRPPFEGKHPIAKPLTAAQSQTSAVSDDEDSSRPYCDSTQPAAPNAPANIATTSEGVLDTSIKGVIQRLEPSVQFLKARGNRIMVQIPTVKIVADGPSGIAAMNYCGLVDEQVPPEESCVTRWEFQVLDSRNEWRRIFTNQGVRNIPLQMNSAYCLPTEASASGPWRYRIVALTEADRTIVSEGTVSGAH